MNEKITIKEIKYTDYDIPNFPESKDLNPMEYKLKSTRYFYRIHLVLLLLNQIKLLATKTKYDIDEIIDLVYYESNSYTNTEPGFYGTEGWFSKEINCIVIKEMNFRNNFTYKEKLELGFFPFSLAKELDRRCNFLLLPEWQIHYGRFYNVKNDDIASESWKNEWIKDKKYLYKIALFTKN